MPGSQQQVVVLRWNYSRTQRRHWVDDGEKYGPDFHDLFEIRDNAPHSETHRFEHGYRLLCKGRQTDNAPWVKTLKATAAYHAAKQHQLSLTTQLADP